MSRWLNLPVSILLAVCLTTCSQEPLPTISLGDLNLGELDSRYNDEQPALSGDGRFLAFVSSRDHTHRLLLYDLQQQRYVDLPRLNRQDAIAESPSLSYTARYIVYVASDNGRPEIELYDRATQISQILTSGRRGWFRHPSISPDGRYVVFESGVSGQWDIALLDRGPGIELDVPDFQRSLSSPGISP